MVRLTIFAILLLCFVSVCSSEDDSDEAVVTEEIDDMVPDEEIVYVSPTPSGNTYLAEHFDDEGRFKQKWIVSEAKKDDMDEEISKYEGTWAIEPPQQDGLKGDQGLVLKSKAKHSAISARLDRPFVFTDKPFIVQYEVAFQEGQDCGGAYLKLLSQSKQSSDLRKFNDKTPYTIMFGPDKCGTDVKLHFIFRHKNPNNGTMSEKHCKKPKDRVEEPYKDKRPHLYTLHLRPDNSFTVFLDQKIINEGNLLEDFTPPVNPPAEIEDPADKKPEDWDEREKIADPEAKKPDDWDEDAPPMIPDESAVKPDGWLEDEPEMIPDPNAEKPDDWDTDMDGEWEAPLITNPACEGAPGCGPWKRPMINNPAHKGKWRPPLIDNPNYKGKWKPRRIPNPDFYEDLHPFKMTPISGLGFELWSMSNMILFDNIIVTDDPAVADRWAAETFSLKIRKLDKDSEGIVMRLVHYTNEHPWLWAVYVIVIGLPIVMLIVFCCGSTPEKAEMKRAADAKKTDAITPDYEDEDVVDDSRPLHKTSPASKSDLELPHNAASNKADGEHVSDGEAEHIDDEEEDEDDEPPPLQESITEGAGDAPRSPKKVRPRKE